MAFFYILLTVRAAGKPISMMVEHKAPSIAALIAHISDTELPWLIGVEHRTIDNDSPAKRWIANDTAVPTAQIARISMVPPPPSLVAHLTATRGSLVLPGEDGALVLFKSASPEKVAK
jgi:hypothetical protein